MLYKLTLPLVLIGLLSQNLFSQTGIKGQIIVDTSLWSSIAYLSLIPDFDNMNTMSNEMIIDKAYIDDSGRFNFNTSYLPEEDVLIRIHISKKDDLPASLIIGGKDENHFFLIANGKSFITVKDSGNSEFIKDILIGGYYPNKMVQEVDRIVSYLDTTDFSGSVIKTELIRNAIFEKLRSIADTCSNPIVALYALYKSKYDRNYPVNQQFYKGFLSKWRHQKSSYFLEFRKKIPSSPVKGIGLVIIICVLSVILGFLICLAYFKGFKKKRNHVHDLSARERKIFALLADGKSNKEISEILMIGISTVKSHVNSIYSKLDINSRKDLLNLDLDNK